MRRVLACMSFVALFSSLAFVQTTAHQSPPTAQVTVVPRLVRFSGTAQDSIGKPLNGAAGITFSLYKDQQGGEPLWMETQNAKLDRTGHYNVMLGGNKPDGLATDVFTSGEARWLGVQVEGQQEQPRVLLVAVPYALKAADAETVGGKPASAFVLAGKQAATSGGIGVPRRHRPRRATPLRAGVNRTLSPGGQPTRPSGPRRYSNLPRPIGINTTTPAAKLDVNGSGIFRGQLISTCRKWLAALESDLDDAGAET